MATIIGNIRGPTGATGPAGPTAVSANAGNIATLGTDSLLLVPQSQIWSTRLRSYNSVGNCNFEVDQRTAGTGTTIATGGFGLDRWTISRAGSTTIGGSFVAAGGAIGGLVVPGTNFQITRQIARFTLTTVQASLAAADFAMIQQIVEGSAARELIADVSSVSILARSSVAGISFGLSLRDSPATKSLVKLCTISTANVWTLITLPNIPVFPAGNFNMVVGSAGYQIAITLAAGSTFTTPANDIFQAGNYLGAVGQSNFGAQIVGSTIDFAFIQHESGPQCTTLMDVPFSQNLIAAQRYFQKSNNQSDKPGTATLSGCVNIYAQPNTHPLALIRFTQPMAKTPTITAFSPSTAASGNIRNVTAGADVAIAGSNAVGDAGFNGFTVASVPSVLTNWQFHYTADTGW